MFSLLLLVQTTPIARPSLVSAARFSPRSEPERLGLGGYSLALRRCALLMGQRCPRLENHSWRSGKAGGPEYRRLRGRRRLGMTSAADIAASGGTIQRAHELLVPIAIDHQLDECGRTSRRRAGVLCCASSGVVQVVVQV